MNKAEWIKLSGIIKTTYHRYPLFEKPEHIQMWYEFLKDIPYEDAEYAVFNHISTSQYPPTIAEIRRGVPKVLEMKSDWSKGWEVVLRMIGKYGTWNEEKALEEMDEVTKETVRRMSWEAICMTENLDVERANFRDIYKSISEANRVNESLPMALRRGYVEGRHQKKLEEVGDSVLQRLLD